MRPGMSDLVGQIRIMADAGTADYTAGTVVMWTDDQLQTMLDRNMTEFYREPTVPVITYDAANTPVYKTHWLPYQYIEGGTAFVLQTADGGSVSASYSLDYANGKLTFTSNQGGTVYYATGRYYDVNLAASEVWRQKAANAAKYYSFSTDNHRFDRAALMKQFMEMSKYYAAQAGPQVGSLERGDLR